MPGLTLSLSLSLLDFLHQLGAPRYRLSLLSVAFTLEWNQLSSISELSRAVTLTHEVCNVHTTRLFV